MKHAFMCIAITAIAMSCSKSEDAAPEPQPEKLSPLEVNVAGSYAYPANTPVKGSSEYSVLGYGYDITGKYADTSSVRLPVFDVASFLKDNPGRYNPGRSISAGGSPVVTGNALQVAQSAYFPLRQDFNVSAFKYAISAYFPATDAFSSRYVYGIYEAQTTVLQYEINGDASRLVPYLTVAFLQDVQNLQAADLVKKYGTHVLTGLYTGQKYKIMYQAETKAANKEVVARAGFARVLDSVFNIGFTGHLDPVQIADMNAVSDQKVSFEVVGGDVSKVVFDKTAAIPRVSFKDWTASITETNGVLVQLRAHGLIGIDEFITNENKKDAVKAYIADYLKSNEAKIVD